MRLKTAIEKLVWILKVQKDDMIFCERTLSDLKIPPMEGLVNAALIDAAGKPILHNVERVERQGIWVTFHSGKVHFFLGTKKISVPINEGSTFKGVAI